MKVAIIGAGPNGLVCAAQLAAAGVDVVVLEQGEAGSYGGISSADGPLPGFRHDICAGFFPLSIVSPALRPVVDDIDWINPPTVMAHPFRDGTAIALKRDIAATAAQLGPEGARYERFMSRLVGEARPLMDAALQPVPPDPGRVIEVASFLRTDLLRLAWRALLPAGLLGRRWLHDDRSAAWLAGSTAHSDLDPTSPGGGAFALVLKLLGHAVGWPFPRGGADALAKALAARVEAGGGEIRHDAAVDAILLEPGGADRGSGAHPRSGAGRGSGAHPRSGAGRGSGAHPGSRAGRRSGRGGIRAIGVRLRSGELIEADAVVSTLSAKPFLELLPKHALPRSVDWRLRHWSYDAGTFKVDFALDGPAPWTADACRRSAVVHVGDTLADFTRSFRASRDGLFPQRPALVIGQHSLFDDSRAPAGKHTLYCYVRSPLSLKIPAEQAADLVQRRIEEFAPGFGDVVLAREVRSPEQMQAHNPSMIGGDLGGGSYQLQHQLFLRPHPRMWRTGTPIPGLYFAGTSAHPGGGVHGTQGLTAALRLLEDQR
jgi:phytoene dehydrogenase-like protein